ncbi:metallophosphoesterase family protein [Pedobacter sp. CG_S7]|uniref:metallophosphoesterase family protein n=1 Tax=Pedobacter sp. CG_S7 TaxID=3143930 RepID=UPI0033956EA4
MDQKIKSLATIEGPLLVFGGVYSNFQTLRVLHAEAQKRDIPASNIICTGDLVAYCAQPLDCIHFIHDWGIHCITGNVEISLYQVNDDCGCNFDEGGRCDTFSRQWYSFLKNEMTLQEIKWMKNLPHFLEFKYSDKRFFVLHGSYQNTSEFIFKSSTWEIKEQIFVKAKADVILAGHCGIPFYQGKHQKLWLNAGVIGMPANDGTPRVWVALLNDAGNNFKFEILPLDYDYMQAANRMKNKALPPGLQRNTSIRHLGQL